MLQPPLICGMTEALRLLLAACDASDCLDGCPEQLSSSARSCPHIYETNDTLALLWRRFASVCFEAESGSA